MAFHYSADKVEMAQNVGTYGPFAYGSVALSGGTATVTVAHAKLVKMAMASSQTGNSARVSAVSGNTFTITGTGTDRVDWMAVVIPG